MALLRTMMVKRDSGEIYTDWTSKGGCLGQGLKSVDNDGTTFISGENYSNNYDVFYTSDVTTTWTKSSNNLNSQRISFLKYCNSYLIGGAYDYKIYTSSSASGVWTSRLTGSTYFHDAIYSTTASLYIVVGSNGILYTATNPASTWTSRTSSFGTGGILSIYDNGSLIVIAGESGKMATSTDGITWTLRTSSFGTSIINKITYGGSTWVFIGADSKIATSSDPTSSVTQNSSTGIATGLSLKALDYDGTEFICCSGRYVFNATTPSGSWTTTNLTVGTAIYNATSNSSYKVLVGVNENDSDRTRCFIKSV